jgi:hypothetical protein
VFNETDRSLNHLILRVGKYEMFLLFDLRPKSVTKLLVDPQTDQTSDLSYISSEGVFIGGERIPEIGKTSEYAVNTWGPPITKSILEKALG